MELRDYQQKCNDSVMAALQENDSTLFVLPTGCGKTISFAHLIKNTPGRALVLAHRKVLINQAAQKIEMVTGDRCAVEMGNNWSSERDGMWRHKAKCVVSTIQTQISGARGDGRMSRFDPNEFSLLIVDEAHRTISESYRKVIRYYQQNKALKVVGCTATPDRADEQALGQIYDSVAFEYEISDAIEDGWLVPIRQQRVFVDSIDFSDVKTTQGDLNGPELAAVMEQEANLHKVADPLFQMTNGRKTVVFASSVAHARRLAEILNRHEAGCAESIDAETLDYERDRIFRELKDGSIRFLINVGICTEGWDEPSVAVVAMARPTKSRALYAQMAGRGTRTLTGLVDNLTSAEDRRIAIAQSEKPFVEIIDFVGNSGKHALITSADILGGKFSDEAIEKVKKEYQEREDGALSEDVIERLKEAEMKLIRARDEAAEARKKIVGRATYRTSESNPFDVFGLTPTKPRGWDQKPLSDKQIALLSRNGIDAGNMTFSQVQQVIGEIIKRMREGKCSFKQARLLKKHGYDGNMSRADASRTIDALAKNGWKRPVYEGAQGA